MEVKFIPAEQLKEKPDENALGFGKYFTDYMFTMDWTKEKGWNNATMDPATMVLHYAQETFEGLKAYRTKEGKLLLFRPEMNAKRFANSNRRLCMEVLPEELFVDAIATLVSYEKDWIPTAEGTSLYIRPFMFATERAVGVHPSNAYKFMIILSPVGAYYPEGVNPVKIYVEDEYVRATKGGPGFAKCGGNYAASIAAQVKAEKLGYTQVLWLDGVERKYVEEGGGMNLMFVWDGKLVTPELNGSILPGVTRKSILELARSWGMETVERKITVDELMEGCKNGTVQEAFMCGTAAVVTPIGGFVRGEEKVVVNHNKIGEMTQKVYDELTGVQWGLKEDKFGWTVKVD